MLCLKQTLTPTLGRVTPIGTKTPEDVDGVKEDSGGIGRVGCRGDHRNSSIVKHSFEEKLKDDCLSKVTITKSGHQATQYKKIIDTSPVLCADKNFRYIDDIICTGTKLLEAAFLPVYPDLRLWSETYHVNIETVNPTVVADATSARPTTTTMVEKTNIFNANHQKQLLLEYNQKFKIKTQEWAKLNADKKSLMNIIFGQCNDATRTECCWYDLRN